MEKTPDETRGSRRILSFRLSWLLFWLPLGLLIVLALLISPAFSNTPLAVSGTRIDSDVAVHANRFLRRSLRQLAGNRRPLILSTSDQELNSLFSLATRALPRLQGSAAISDAGIGWAVSFRLPDNPLGKYLSVSGRISASTEGLDLGPLHIGRLQLPGPVINYLAEQLLNVALGDNQGSQLLGSVKSLTTTSGIALLHTEPPPDLPRRLKRISQRFKQLSADAGLFADTEDTRHYFRFLVDQQRKKKVVSLADALNPLIQEAARRSDPATAADQNRAALLALAVYLGSYHFEKLIGDISPSGYRSPLALRRVGLGGRRDLRLHFVFSAALQILSDQGVSLTIGEFKELLDSETGGSGFSFIDLAADRAGARFAALATADPGSARTLQQRFSNPLPESAIFPSFSDLPEGLSDTEFKRRYRDLNSPAYQAMEKLIDQRLSRLPAYGG